MNDTISVIVPVYNVAAYLPACIRSICAQTYSQLEVILIDDGSTDDSGTLCDKFAENDYRIKVIHQQNGGAASAKNAGLRAATGDYLAFVDSDDYLEPDAYSFMMEKMQQYAADVVRCGFQEVYTDSVVNRTDHLLMEVNTPEEFLGKFTTDWTCGLLWDKLYRRELFEGIFFEEGHRIDDEFFTYQGLLRAKRIVTIPKVIYSYRKRKSSVMSSADSQKKIILDKLEYAEKRREKVIAVFPQLKKIYDDHYANFLLLLCRDAYITENSMARIKKQMASFLRKKNRPCIGARMMLTLGKTILTPNRILLKRKQEATVDARLENYFD